MIKDEIVEETRRLRDEYAKQFNYDLRKMYEDLKMKRKESKSTYLTLSDEEPLIPKETKKAA